MNYFKKRNKEAESQIDKLIEQGKTEILRHLGGQVITIVLRGALSKGEGAWKRINGKLKIISDVDLLVISKLTAAVPKKLEHKLREIESRTGISMELWIKTRLEFNLSSMDLWAYDMKETGTILYGRDIFSNLAQLSRDSLDFKSAVTLFFNRHLATIFNCSPDDLAHTSYEALERLSYGACGMMFTCLDFILLYYGSYSSFLFEREKLVRNKLPHLDIGIDKERFISDVDKAIIFKFEQVDVPFLQDAKEFWFRAREHLINLFESYFMREYGTIDISKYPYLERKGSFLRKAIRFTLGRLVLFVKFLKVKKFLNWFYFGPDLLFNYHMASLMLCMALGEKLQGECVVKADEYLSKVYFRRRRGAGNKERWLTIREELKEIHDRLRLI